MEKVITIEELKQRIEKMLKEQREWKSRDNRYTTSMMLDVSDASVWCDCFIDENSWKEYHSDTIIYIDIFPYHSFNDLVEWYSCLLLKNGWEITKEGEK